MKTPQAVPHSLAVKAWGHKAIDLLFPGLEGSLPKGFYTYDGRAIYVGAEGHRYMFKRLCSLSDKQDLESFKIEVYPYSIEDFGIKSFPHGKFDLFYVVLKMEVRFNGEARTFQGMGGASVKSGEGERNQYQLVTDWYSGKLFGPRDIIPFALEVRAERHLFKLVNRFLMQKVFGVFISDDTEEKMASSDSELPPEEEDKGPSEVEFKPNMMATEAARKKVFVDQLNAGLTRSGEQDATNAEARIAFRLFGKQNMGTLLKKFLDIRREKPNESQVQWIEDQASGFKVDVDKTVLLNLLAAEEYNGGNMD